MSKSMRIEEEKLKRPKRDNDEIKRKERENRVDDGSDDGEETEKQTPNGPRRYDTIPYVFTVQCSGPKILANESLPDSHHLHARHLHLIGWRQSHTKQHNNASFLYGVRTKKRKGNT